jgi:hypothetical protein
MAYPGCQLEHNWLEEERTRAREASKFTMQPSIFNGELRRSFPLKVRIFKNVAWFVTHSQAKASQAIS